MNQESDQNRLLERARSGDNSALEALLLAVQPQLYRFSMKMCRHTEDAEDVMQDSMMTLARSFRDFRGASSFSTWLFTIVRSYCIKKRRKSKFAPEREESLEQLDPAEQQQILSPIPDPQKQAESAEIWREVHAAIQCIKPSYREVLVLRDIEGLSAKEVAEVVGISVPAVKSRLHRARDDLRTHLAATPYRPGPNCPNIRKVFSKHIEGELSTEICSAMESHIANCQTCAAECDGLKSALNACSSSPCAEVPVAVQQRVKESLRLVLKQPKP
jgi:RNA polymerase sigma-70 factor, ECF subfamily